MEKLTGKSNEKARQITKEILHWMDGDQMYAGQEQLHEEVARFIEPTIRALQTENVRLNDWCDGFSDRNLKERATGIAYQDELKKRAEKAEAERDEAQAKLKAMEALVELRRRI